MPKFYKFPLSHWQIFSIKRRRISTFRDILLRRLLSNKNFTSQFKNQRIVLLKIIEYDSDQCKQRWSVRKFKQESDDRDRRGDLFGSVLDETDYKAWSLSSIVFHGYRAKFQQILHCSPPWTRSLYIYVKVILPGATLSRMRTLINMRTGFGSC